MYGQIFVQKEKNKKKKAVTKQDVSKEVKFFFFFCADETKAQLGVILISKNKYLFIFSFLKFFNSSIQ